ncbi:MAG: hypothetical protein KC657_22420 [Myxococcales bacterium]|nr:hypothetical protein [Myxococcales bacterium]MCB9609434.1 hypothetical protein [Polyangiaceae bacterium]
MKALIALSLLGITALPFSQAGSRAPAASPAIDDGAPDGGLVTMWLLDGVTDSISLNTGEPASVVRQHELRNRDGQLDFGGYYPGEFTVGIQGGESGRIVDLGAESELSERYSFEETVGGGQGFASIHFADGAIRIRAGAGSVPGQKCAEALAVFAEEPRGNHAPIRLDHVYLVRIVDRHDEEYELLAKLHVVGYQPGQSVTVRWQRLER